VRRYVTPYVASPSFLPSPPLMVLAELPHVQYAGEVLPARWQASLLAAGLDVRVATPTHPSYDVHDFIHTSRISQTASFLIVRQVLPASTHQGEGYLYAIRPTFVSLFHPGTYGTSLQSFDTITQSLTHPPHPSRPMTIARSLPCSPPHNFVFVCMYIVLPHID
jgi:hypothetical protein